jgi:response regulator RpfG family c-di-GMP phosphodiesterase
MATNTTQEAAQAPLSERILIVDDDQALLDSLRRSHRKEHDLHTALGGPEGLRAIETQGPFAVVVSDYQMPGMNGIEFLGKARERAPDTVRVMLTGNADLQSAIDAVNQGHVFRFLTKPCPPEMFAGCLVAAKEQYELRHAERVLLERTVRGSIEVLISVLSLSSPGAFGRATRVRDLVRHIVTTLRLEAGWQYETAALLSQIGYVAIPESVIDRMAQGEALTPAESAMLERHPQIGRDLLCKIPRLQTVAEIVLNQMPHPLPAGAAKFDAAQFGGRILAAALAFEELLSLGATPKRALEALKKDAERYDLRVLTALGSAAALSQTPATRILTLAELQPGMVLAENVSNTDGSLVLPKGHEISAGSLQRLRNYGQLDLLDKAEFLVRGGKAVSEGGQRVA